MPIIAILFSCIQNSKSLTLRFTHSCIEELCIEINHNDLTDPYVKELVQFMSERYSSSLLALIAFVILVG